MGRLINKSPLSNNTFNLEAVNFVNDYKGPRGDYNIETKDVVDENGTIISQELHIVDAKSSEINIIELEYPFHDQTSSLDLFVHKLSNDNFLFSARSEASGLWLLDTSTKTFTKLADIGGWNVFGNALSSCVIGSTVSHKGLLLYNDESKSVSYLKPSSTARWENIKSFNDSCIISSNSSKTDEKGLWIYDGVTNNFSQLIDAGYDWSTIQQIDEVTCLLSGNNSAGLLFYDNSAKTVELKLSGTGTSNYTYFKKIGSNWIITGSYAQAHIILYNEITKNASLLYDKGYYWTTFIDLNESECLITSSQNSDILYFNNNLGSIKELYIHSAATAGGSTLYSIHNNICLISRSNHGTLISYNIDTKEMVSIEALKAFTYYYWLDDRCILSSTAANSGLYEYKIDGNIFSQIYTEGSTYRYGHIVKNNVLLTRTTEGNGLFLYDKSDSSVSILRDTGQWQYSKVVDNLCFLSGGGSTLLYDSSDKSIIQLIDKNVSQFHPIPTGMLLAYQDLYVYKYADKSVAKIVSGNIEYFYPKDDTYIISYYSTRGGLYEYNLETDTLDMIYRYGQQWSTIVEINARKMLATPHNNILFNLDTKQGEIGRWYSATLYNDFTLGDYNILCDLKKKKLFLLDKCYEQFNLTSNIAKVIDGWYYTPNTSDYQSFILIDMTRR